MIEIDRRAELLARGAAEWRSADSSVRAEARAALAGSEWSPEVVEAALDNVLHDVDDDRARTIARMRTPADPRPVLVILPGNIIGPAIAAAYCAAAAGASAILKSPGVEQSLAPIVASQFDRLGPPLKGAVEARYWKGGDAQFERDAFPNARRIIVFGDDETIAAVRARAGDADVVAYGDAFSIAYVTRGAALEGASRSAARSVALFDQRGCMSPQTIYVEGDDGRALQFARLLAGALDRIGLELPRAAPAAGEPGLCADVVRRLSVLAVAPKTHALDTVIVGRSSKGADNKPPDYVVAVLPYGAPFRAGFGRVVAVMACPSPDALREAVAPCGAQLDTIGVAEQENDARPESTDPRFAANARRICELSEMQRPPLGYRPAVEDFS